MVRQVAGPGGDPQWNPAACFSLGVGLATGCAPRLPSASLAGWLV
jgi:hypothetical protein